MIRQVLRKPLMAAALALGIVLALAGCVVVPYDPGHHHWDSDRHHHHHHDRRR